MSATHPPEQPMPSAMTDRELAPCPHCGSSPSDLTTAYLAGVHHDGECGRHACRRVRTEMQAEIERLRADAERLQAEVGRLHMHAQRRDAYALEKAAETLAAVKRANAAEEDAERYRFIRDASEAGDPDLRRWTECYDAIGGAETAEQIDRLVDAAIGTDRGSDGRG